MTDIFDQMNAPAPDTAEVKLALDGQPQAALDKLAHVLSYCVKSGAASLYVSFPPAQPGAEGNLFQPVGQALRQAKARGHIAQAVPVMQPESSGFFVRLAQGQG